MRDRDLLISLRNGNPRAKHGRLSIIFGEYVETEGREIDSTREESIRQTTRRWLDNDSLCVGSIGLFARGLIKVASTLHVAPNERYFLPVSPYLLIDSGCHTSDSYDFAGGSKRILATVKYSARAPSANSPLKELLECVTAAETEESRSSPSWSSIARPDIAEPVLRLQFTSGISIRCNLPIKVSDSSNLI